MKFAVCLYKFFPFGGLARDFVRIMQATLTEGDSVDVFVMERHGEVPSNFRVHVIPVSGRSNHAKLKSFQDHLNRHLSEHHYDLVIGFNKMPGLDLYYAADPCYLDRLKSNPLYFLLKHTGRVKFYSACEAAVFGRHSRTVSLMISDVQRKLFEKHYATQNERLIDLPPGIDPNRKRPADAEVVRAEIRQQLGIDENQWLLLMIGTGFKTKGVDRAISAMAQLPDRLRTQTKLCILGEGGTSSLQKLAIKAGLERQVMFMGGRSDVPGFLLAADLLVHPARKENTGTVILEAIVAGLPVLVSDVCGYAKHVIKSDAGCVMTDAGDAGRFAEQLSKMLDRPCLQQWSNNALSYAANEDLYSMPQKAATIIRQLAANKQEGKAT